MKRRVVFWHIGSQKKHTKYDSLQHVIVDIIDQENSRCLEMKAGDNI